MDTSGGPPSTYTWTRDGAEITDGGPFSISIAVNTVVTRLTPDERTRDAYQQARYRSTLAVNGIHPGVYRYSVTNRATPNMVADTINIEGRHHNQEPA